MSFVTAQTTVDSDFCPTTTAGDSAFFQQQALLISPSFKFHPDSIYLQLLVLVLLLFGISRKWLFDLCVVSHLLLATFCRAAIASESSLDCPFLKVKNAETWVHLSLLVWICCAVFEGRSVFLLARLIWRVPCRQTFRCVFGRIIALAVIITMTAFSYCVFGGLYFNYVYQSVEHISMGYEVLGVLFFDAAIEGGKIILQGLLFCAILIGMDVHLVKRDVFRITLSNIVMLLNSLALFYSLSPMRLLLSKSSPDLQEHPGLFFMGVDLLLRFVFTCFLLVPLFRKPQQPTELQQPTECSKPSNMRVFTRKSSLCFPHPSEEQYVFQYLTPCLPVTS